MSIELNYFMHIPLAWKMKVKKVLIIRLWKFGQFNKEKLISLNMNEYFRSTNQITINGTNDDDGGDSETS